MKKIAAIPALTAFTAFALLAQQTPPPRFEVASIKPSDPAAGNGMKIGMSPGGLFQAKNVTLQSLIQQAWEMRDFQFTGAPGWVSTERYDIQAKGPGAGVSEEELGRMPSQQRRVFELKFLAELQGLLLDRFQLKLHKETRELPIYALVVAKGGVKFQAAVDDGKPGGNLNMRRGDGGKTDVTASKLPLTYLTRLVSNQVGRMVLDQTGLKGDYDFKFTFAPDLAPQEGGAGVDGPSLFTALQEQLGLRLDAQKGPVEVLVIDSVQKASEN